MEIIKKITIPRHLDCYLTNDEKADYAERLAKKLQEKDEIQDEKKEAMAGYKSQLEACSKIINNLKNAVNNGKEKRTVDCEVQLNTPNTGIKTITRIDTGEEWTEEMTEDERQENLSFVERPADEIPEEVKPE